MNTLRSFQWSDEPAISKIWEEHFSHVYSLPNRKSIIVDAVVENEDKIIGYGQVRLFAEAMLFLDYNASKKDRIDALKKLMLEAFRGTQVAGIQELYAFILDPDFAKLIEKHFHFFPADRPGDLFVKEL
jgi:hypothetical protein